MSEPAACDPAYTGSRRVKQRYEDGEETTAGFIELSQEHVLSTDKFRQLLIAVPGVWQVIDHPKGTKAEQGNPGDHYQQQNFFVYSNTLDKHPMEFELTRNNHMKDPKVPFTVSACFKGPPPALVPEAWRILRKACAGKELLPTWVAT